VPTDDATSDLSLGPLAELVARLRAPDGCPWDREQRLADLRGYLLEEAHEAAAAIDAMDLEALRGELGDLQFQIVFLATLANEQGEFTLAEVLAEIHAKMVARHPHVFGREEERLADAAAVRTAWEKRKAREKHPEQSLLAGVQPSLPALLAAYRLTQKAAGVGFDWPDAAAVFAKIDEELHELREALGAPAASAPEDASTRREALAEEVGDLLFAVANLARHLGFDPEAALAGTNAKFRRRFEFIERELAARGRRLDAAELAEMDALWNEAKRREREVQPPSGPAGVAPRS
jgi:ATP diphosphatase